ncbi:hypothetical protein L6164_026360 [Bauhinia variegata]|uniref:Uncharacterized protein n=2 Tax=Bauhinia variegata TaxID=167791 RepID=A0ACB9LQQ2_BAUVA|nr:hypothetical protein L6164_026283 [Bauhinia variegata]KAI4313373.1 hypothetical protein L6164_026360 [Bauhinia variegata]
MKRRKLKQTTPSEQLKPQQQLVSYDELRLATGNFSQENLIGSGSFGSEFLALVYEFLSNGSLEDWIKGTRKHANGKELNLMERLNMSIDVAYALQYLHYDNEIPIVHCDLKPNNILLDKDMTAKIGDFGLARMLIERSSGQVSIGYIPPDAIYDHLNAKNPNLQLDCLSTILQVGLSCTADFPQERISIRDVVRKLEASKEILLKAAKIYRPSNHYY